MSNKPKPKKSYTQVCCMPPIQPIEEQRDWLDRHRYDDSPRKPFDPEKLKYILSDEAGMRPDFDTFDGTNIPHFWRDEVGQMPSADPPLTKEEIHRMKETNWIKSAAAPKSKKQ